MRKTLKRNILSVLLLITLVVSSLSVLIPKVALTKVAADNNPATWVMCKTDDGKMLYNAATTDLLPYSIRSKSNVTKTDNLDSFLNMILGVSGFKFQEVNEQILGRPIVDHGLSDSEQKDKDKNKDKEEDKDDEKTEDGKKPEANPNATAPRVNPFDRFGMAGLRWSSYSGEWKYYETDGCQPDGKEASKTDFGVFYKDRKEPKASFTETVDSKDPRVIQYNKGTFLSWANATNGMITNGLLNITKTIVTFTIALISFALSDVTDLIGLGSSNGGGLIGMFNNLYNGFFTPLVSLAILLTACYVMYYGLIKRQIRQALISGLAQALICMFLAMVIAAKPDFWIPLPNRIATYGESIVISAMGQSTSGQNGLCGTNVGAMNLSNVNINGTHEQRSNEMAKISQNMKSTVGCRMWEEFLFKPWVQGQFGSEYDELVVNGAKGHKLNNINSKWTHKAPVPLGGNVVEHNLALFQLSTQTNAHAQVNPETGNATDPETNKIKMVDGMTTDWWRIVDILSNYDEVKKSEKPQGGETEVETEVQADSAPLPQWQSWIGNRQLDRYNNAIISVVFGGLGSAGPLIFGMLTAIYSVGVTLLMAISPIFLLLGVWAGKGQTLFRGWLEALVSTMIKKIVSAGLLLISFAFTISAMNMINEIGRIKAFLLLFIMTLVLLKNKGKIYAIFSNVNFGGALRPDLMFKKYAKDKTQYADEIGLVGAAAYKGARQAQRQGMSAADGMKIAAGLQMRNTLRKNTFGRNIERQMRDQAPRRQYCIYCSQEVSEGQGAHYHYYTDVDGNPICRNCAMEMGLETELYKMEGTNTKDNMKKSDRKVTRKLNEQRLLSRDILENENPPEVKLRNQKKQATTNSSWLSYTKAQNMMDLSYDDDGNVYWGNEGVENMMVNNMKSLSRSIEEYEAAWRVDGEGANTPAVPEPISTYVSTAFVDEAWHAGRYDIVRDEYQEAWKNWYVDNSLDIENVSEEDVQKTLEVLDDVEVDITPTPLSKEEAQLRVEEIDAKNKASKERAKAKRAKENDDFMKNPTQEEVQTETVSEEEDEKCKDNDLHREFTPKRDINEQSKKTGPTSTQINFTEADFHDHDIRTMRDSQTTSQSESEEELSENDKRKRAYLERFAKDREENRNKRK